MKRQSPAKAWIYLLHIGMILGFSLIPVFVDLVFINKKVKSSGRQEHNCIDSPWI